MLAPHGETLDPQHVLSAWIQFYLAVRVQGGSEHTRRAKESDLQKFLRFFVDQLGTERVDFWTPSMSKAFLKWLHTAPRREVGAAERRKGEGDRPLAATSVNRILATLRHFGGWLHGQRPLPTGHPFEGVKNLAIDEPAWNGLTVREVTRLKIACEQRLALCTRADQNALLETAVFYCLLFTGLRESELAALNVGQYHHRGFHQVKRKGSKISGKVSVPAEAKAWLDRYLESREGELADQEPLFVTRYSNRIARKDIYRIARRICDQANATGDGIRLTPHMLRHTFLKRVANKHGVHVAQEISGNISMREIFRYTKPSQEEKDRLAVILF
ncbi:tyrosine-type recombinase/integrase [Catalinimonas alkaloidigena]|nr:tyrosine-type recombinase/integrase [Catalinimonas alkaloidigena]